MFMRARPLNTNTNTDPYHLPLYLTHLLTYLYKQASSVSSIRVSVRGQGSCSWLVLGVWCKKKEVILVLIKGGGVRKEQKKQK